MQEKTIYAVVDKLGKNITVKDRDKILTIVNMTDGKPKKSKLNVPAITSDGVFTHVDVNIAVSNNGIEISLENDKNHINIPLYAEEDLLKEDKIEPVNSPDESGIPYEVYKESRDLCRLVDSFYTGINTLSIDQLNQLLDVLKSINFDSCKPILVDRISKQVKLQNSIEKIKDILSRSISESDDNLIKIATQIAKDLVEYTADESVEEYPDIG
jgi:hypothetical protein